ncbi:MAG: transposase [Prolixibacteraceae bacterium]|jgi:putative transposase|nr:transposase [Prolixibacteraceae bacterium]
MPQHKSQYRRNLPHIVPIEGMFHVVFRVKDSIPNHIVEKFKSDYDDQKLNITTNSKEEYLQILNRLNNEYFEKFESELHKSPIKPLADFKNAEIVQNAILYFQNKRYTILAYSIMPNHVHILLSNLKKHLADILKPMKGFSARKINKQGGTKGTFWQDESYDHLIRSRNEMADTVNYIINNPVKAGICNHYTEHDFTWCADFMAEE